MILTIDIVVLTFCVVEPDIAETTIWKSKNSMSVTYDIVEITISKDKTSISIYHFIEVPTISVSIVRFDIGIEYGRAHSPALQAVRRCTGHELQCT